MDFLFAIVTAISIVAAGTAIVIGILMLTVSKKFGQGILASGFKKITLGVLLITIAILLDVIITSSQNPIGIFSTLLPVLKYLLFIAGTIIIYRGSKRTSDQLDSLMKK